MTIKKPAEFRPASNYDTNPYYDTNFDHTVTDPFKKIDSRLDDLEDTVDAAETGLSDRVEALETTVDTASTGLSDRVEALETTVDTAGTGLSDRVAALEQAGPFLFSIIDPEIENGPLTLDKTYADFEEALLAGKPIYQYAADETATPPIEVYYSSFNVIGNNAGDLPYGVSITVMGSPFAFCAATKDGVLTQVLDH